MTDALSTIDTIHRLTGDYRWTYQHVTRWTLTDEQAVERLRNGETTTKGRAYAQGRTPQDWLDQYAKETAS